VFPLCRRYSARGTGRRGREKKKKKKKEKKKESVVRPDGSEPVTSAIDGSIR
jgi:hypothetical protein